MKKQKGRPWIRWILISLGGFGGYHLLTGSSGLLKLMGLKRDAYEQQRLTDSLGLRREELRAEKKLLLTDSSYMEKAARRELGMAKPGEKVYRFLKPRE